MMPPMIRSLCETCSQKKDVVSGNGSRFLLCLLSQRDRRFAKYPSQPVIGCEGYERVTGEEARPE